MARPRKPLALVALEGRNLLHAGRFKGRTEPRSTGPLGQPPDWLLDTPECHARAAWLAFEREVPWLNRSHRLLTAIACRVQGRLIAGQDVEPGALNLLRLCLSAMGAVPTKVLS
jgi:hypothetical protein